MHYPIPHRKSVVKYVGLLPLITSAGPLQHFRIPAQNLSGHQRSAARGKCTAGKLRDGFVRQLSRARRRSRYKSAREQCPRMNRMGPVFQSSCVVELDDRRRSTAKLGTPFELWTANSTLDAWPPMAFFIRSAASRATALAPQGVSFCCSGGSLRVVCPGLQLSRKSLLPWFPSLDVFLGPEGENNKQEGGGISLIAQTTSTSLLFVLVVVEEGLSPVFASEFDRVDVLVEVEANDGMGSV